jgi:hypothetical protein
MSFANTAPDLMVAAADLAGIGSEISAANAATSSTTGVLPAAAEAVCGAAAVRVVGALGGQVAGGSATRRTRYPLPTVRDDPRVRRGAAR